MTVMELIWAADGVERVTEEREDGKTERTKIEVCSNLSMQRRVIVRF